MANSNNTTNASRLTISVKNSGKDKFFRTTETFKDIPLIEVDRTIDYVLNDVFGNNNRENLKKVCYNGKQII